MKKGKKKLQLNRETMAYLAEVRAGVCTGNYTECCWASREVACETYGTGCGPTGFC